VLTAAGRAANRAAAHHVFADYRQRRAEKTLRTQRAALMLWVEYLAAVGAAEELLAEAEAWALANPDKREQGVHTRCSHQRIESRVRRARKRDSVDVLQRLQSLEDAKFLQMLGDQIAQLSNKLGRGLDDQGTFAGHVRREILRVQR
jgi:hypothetical protein